MDQKTYHHGDLKRALIEAGLRLLDEAGPEGLSLRAIAARVGVSHAAPQRHFDGLRGLKTAMATEGFARLALQMRAALPPDAGLGARRRQAITAYARFALDHRHLFTLMFSTRDADFTDPALRRATADCHAILSDVAQGLEPLFAPAADAGERAETFLWAIGHGFAQLALTGLIATAPDGARVPAIEDILPPAFLGLGDSPGG